MGELFKDESDARRKDLIEFTALCPGIDDKWFYPSTVTPNEVRVDIEVKGLEELVEVTKSGKVKRLKRKFEYNELGFTEGLS